MKTLEEAIKELYVWQHGNSNSFYTSLISIYHSKADQTNREKLNRAYPFLRMAYVLWINATDNGNDLFRAYNLMPDKYELEEVKSMNNESVEEEGGIEDQTKWVHYFVVHFDSILEWIKEFSPSRYDLLLEKNKSEQFSIPEMQEILSDAWTFCEDSPRIRTGGFFHLCNLLDGGYLK